MNAYDDRPCELGEGPLWHPERRQFFWFDILNRRLLSRDGGRAREWRFDRMASAAGWVDRDRLMIATETGLALLDLRDGSLGDVAAVEADDPETRSNDGRADRQGGFWFSTMGKSAQAGRGSIYRYYRGQVRRVVEGLTISNAICFAPDGRSAYYSCTKAATVWWLPLDADGWPDGPAQLFLDLSPEGANPDGAVVDSEGGFCCALWGLGAVRRYDADGKQTHQIAVPGRHSSCPAFGGEDFRDMLVTTALEGIEKPDALQGLPYLVRAPFPGLPEPRVIL
ncbi:SMP-30/gluconolactonase/LRE family protein [Paracoccus beibuensis]|uniref:SMP-30/gluconolactonase/LRE family protein n=1 Tax=Paracoccus beibuensis TaxID=547602 RepID=UPI002240C5CB|nr:SMP-30/gluconolactonase/LRE family protein [Paracoccus beibuensis]